MTRQALPITGGVSQQSPILGESVPVRDIPDRLDKFYEEGPFLGEDVEEKGIDWAKQFPTDEALLAMWQKIEPLFHEAFSLCSNSMEQQKTVTRNTQIDKRSISWFIGAGFLTTADYKTVDLVQHYAGIVNYNRPQYVYWLKKPRDKTYVEPVQIPGSILTSPPYPSRVGFFPELLEKAGELIPKLKKMNRDLKGGEGRRRFDRAVNPNAMNRREPREAPMKTRQPMPGALQNIVY